MSPPDRAKILIIDDIPENIHILMALLREEFAIIAATDGEQGLRMANLEPRPDLILLDIMMPGISGYEVCARLKKNEATRDIPVVFISALDQEQDEASGLAMGAVDYIHKPVRPTIVKARLRNHLELSRARKKLQEQNQALIEAASLREDMERIARHDLKTPLNAIIGFPKLLREDNGMFNAEQRAMMLSHIEKSGYTMLNMINMSLNLYKMETGTYELQPEPVDIRQIIDEIRADQQLTAGFGDNGIHVTGALENSAGFSVYGERLLCYSLLANLIKNGLEASPTGCPVTIELATENQEMVICIHNQGAVPEEIRPRFFEKYVTAGKPSGSGLGTYSARLITKVQGGKIELDTSRVGETRVCVRLPGVRE